MQTAHGRRRRRIRTLFVSDVHLGCKHAHAEQFLEFLQQHSPEQIFLVGDIIDGWKLRRSLAWHPVFNEILAHLYELAESGTAIYYTPGNHDAFLRGLPWNFSFIRVQDEFVFEAMDGRRFLVTHGDKFDRVECAAGWVSRIAAVGYDVLLSANRCVSHWRQLRPGSEYSLGAVIKRRVKQFVRYISDFERRLVDHARRQGCDGVICGHIHTPAQTEIDGIAYCNTGDWVENCTALVEYETGELALLRHFDDAPPIEPLEVDFPHEEFAATASTVA